MKKRIRMYKVDVKYRFLRPMFIVVFGIQGTTIQWEHKLPDVPCAVQSFYHEAPS